MTDYIGTSGNLALFSKEEYGVVVDTELAIVVTVGDLSRLKESSSWGDESYDIDDTIFLAANNVDLSVGMSITASGSSRMYTIPSGVQAEAKKALEWHKEHHRGGTPVGLNTARTLAAGGQIGIEKVRHIAKYFPRHEVDKQGEGYTPGEKNFPSNGRIAWALWGGDAGQKWAKTIVERENKKAVTAGGVVIDLDSEDMETTASKALYAFTQAYILDESYGPEFVARFKMDSAVIDRLYKIDIDGDVSVWDDCSWDALGNINNTIWNIDSELDDINHDDEQYDYILVDPSSAVTIAGKFEADPYGLVSVADINPEEAEMMANGLLDEDVDFIDFIITAAAGDGNYTPEERSTIAHSALRDSTGRFASKGTRVVVGNDGDNGRGEIIGVNKATGGVEVKLDNGKTISTQAKTTQPEVGFKQVAAPKVAPKLDTTGILGKTAVQNHAPKASINPPKPVLDAGQIEEFVTGWKQGVTQARSSAATPSPASVAAAATPATTQQDPASSDVSATYFAIVSPDDPAAVMDLVALVPETATNTTPLTYRREKKQWVLDEQIARDIQSATPPPVVLITSDELNDILTQVDSANGTEKTPPPASDESATPPTVASVFASFWGLEPLEAVLAAGGLDRNRGNAEKLRRYWVHGEGAAKIRWGQKGDWARCVLHLEKYLGPRAKGYCQLRHKEAMGVYTATHAKMDRKHG